MQFVGNIGLQVRREKMIKKAARYSIVLLLVALISVGCVSSGAHQKVVDERDQLSQQLAARIQERGDLQRSLTATEADLASTKAKRDELQSRLTAANEPEKRYLALGDSLAVGVGASDLATTAYVPLFHQFLLTEEDEDMLLVNLGHSGDTSSDFITHGHLAAALTLTAIESGDVEVLTVDIGGNDLFSLLSVCSSGLTPACLTATSTTLTTFSSNFDLILSELRTAVGSDTPIIVMTYYNSLVNSACFFNPLAPLTDIVLEGGGLLQAGLNNLIRSIAAVHGAQVADTFGLLGHSDLQPDCAHANDAGYEIIAGEFIKAFDKLLP